MAIYLPEKTPETTGLSCGLGSFVRQVGGVRAGPVCARILCGNLTGAGPRLPFLKMCAVLSGGMTALLLTPGTGICKPAFGVAARYQQTVAAGD